MPSYEEVVAEARRSNKMRLQRYRFLDDSRCRDPEWDMLVDLFLQKIDGKETSVSSLTLAANVPSTTSLRHIGLLIDDGMIERRSCPNDKRRSLCTLTEKAFKSVYAYFEAAASLHARPAHDDKICCHAHAEMLRLIEAAAPTKQFVGQEPAQRAVQ